jgi:putative membrane protein
VHPSNARDHLIALGVVAVVFVWSLIAPHDYFTWILEVAPVIIGAIALAALYSRFRFTRQVLALIAIHSMILMVGGHYTYAQVPLFDWIRDVTGGTRNSYDGVGHFAQGFVPAMIAREVLLRKTPLKRGAGLFFIVVCICLAISAMYELVEWGTAVTSGAAAEDFLGTQGDPWDTQKDMALALVGAIVGQVLLSRWQDRQLEMMNENELCLRGDIFALEFQY